MPEAIGATRIHSRPTSSGCDLTLPDEPWVGEALCAQIDVGDLFYPEAGSNSRDAKRICQSCPVIAECLQYALDIDDRHGIYGGLSPRQRQNLATERRRTDGTLGQRACAICATRFVAATAGAKYCSPDCQRAARRKRSA